MYQVLIVDKNAQFSIPESKGEHTFHVPRVGEHVLLKWLGETKVCEVEDIWTHINLEQDRTVQGVVQVLVRWEKGQSPTDYIQRFR